jgi:hypothetical protein
MITRLVAPRSVLAETFGQLRVCGANRRECVVYWCATRADSNVVSRVVHPEHLGGRFGYEVNSAWVTRFFLDLRVRGETVRAQVHTHPGPASHSAVDDRFALAPSTGFLSLVIPNFATGPVGLNDTHLVVMQRDGTWLATDPASALAHE